MAWLLWVLIGAVIGVIGKAVLPGSRAALWWSSIVVGIAGGVIGGWVGARVWSGDVTQASTASLIGAAVGAAVVLGYYDWRWRRGKVGPDEKPSQRRAA